MSFAIPPLPKGSIYLLNIPHLARGSPRPCSRLVKLPKNKARAIKTKCSIEVNLHLLNRSYEKPYQWRVFYSFVWEVFRFKFNWSQPLRSSLLLFWTWHVSDTDRKHLSRLILTVVTFQLSKGHLRYLDPKQLWPGYLWIVNKRGLGTNIDYMF